MINGPGMTFDHTATYFLINQTNGNMILTNQRKMHVISSRRLTCNCCLKVFTASVDCGRLPWTRVLPAIAVRLIAYR